MALATLLAVALGGRARAADDLLNELRTVSRVRLVGVHSVSQGEIRRTMKTRAGGMWPWARDPALRLDFLRADTSSIAALYRHNGFLEARVDYVVASTGKGDKVEVIFNVTEGARSRIASVTVNGVAAMSPQTLLRKLWAKKGREFDPAYLQLDTLRIASAYQEIGYLPHTRASSARDATWVHVRYDVIEGPRYRYGDAYVSGLVKVREYLVRRELALPKGEVYRASRVQQSAEHLYESGLFDRVQVTTIPDSTTQSMFFDVLVHERKPRWIDAGLGTGTSQRFRATASWGHRNLNTRGLQGALTYTLAFDQDGRFLLSRPEVALLTPWLFGLRVPARLSGYYEDKRDRADPRWLLRQKTEGVALELRRDLSRFTRISLTQDNSFVRQSLDYRLPISQDVQDSLAKFFKSDYHIHKLQLALDRDTRDNPLAPGRGSIQSLSSQIAGGILRGETNFHKHIAEFRWYVPFRGDFVFASRIRGGIILPFGESQFSPDVAIDDQVRRVPVEDRFRLGGATSIRGFNEDEISQGRSGGLAMLLGNAEVRFPVYKLLHGEAFLDAGNAWARPEFIDWGDFWPVKSDKRLAPQDVRYVVGTGVSLQLPVGALRVDWSWALRNAPLRDRIVGAWQFAIGPAF